MKRWWRCAFVDCENFLYIALHIVQARQPSKHFVCRTFHARSRLVASCRGCSSVFFTYGDECCCWCAELLCCVCKSVADSKQTSAAADDNDDDDDNGCVCVRQNTRHLCSSIFALCDECIVFAMSNGLGILWSKLVVGTAAESFQVSCTVYWWWRNEISKSTYTISDCWLMMTQEGWRCCNCL